MKKARQLKRVGKLPVEQALNLAQRLGRKFRPLGVLSAEDYQQVALCYMLEHKVTSKPMAWSYGRIAILRAREKELDELYPSRPPAQHQGEDWQDYDNRLAAWRATGRVSLNSTVEDGDGNSVELLEVIPSVVEYEALVGWRLALRKLGRADTVEMQQLRRAAVAKLQGGNLEQRGDTVVRLPLTKSQKELLASAAKEYLG